MNHRPAHSLSLVLLLALCCAACGTPPSSSPDGGTGLDAQSAPVDGGADVPDAGPSADGGGVSPDGGPVAIPPDAGTDAGAATSLKVLKATSESATAVIVEFERAVDPGTVLPGGSQFTFTGGLTASAASASAQEVRVTTSAQTAGANYIVTVATSVRDTAGVAVGGSDNSAEFIAPQGQARLVLNEINPNIPNSRDLIELLVVQAGTTKQMAVVEEGKTGDPLTFSTFPDVAVQVGDLVVLHLNPVGADDPKASERLSKSESTAADAFPNAWDFVGGSAAVTFSHRLVKLVAADGTVQDAVAFAKVGLAPPLPGGFEGAVADAQAAGEWLPADCGGALCAYDSTPSVLDLSVDWSAVGNTRESSLSRVPGPDTNAKEDWVLKASGASFGAANP